MISALEIKEAQSFESTLRRKLEELGKQLKQAVYEDKDRLRVKILDTGYITPYILATLALKGFDFSKGKNEIVIWIGKVLTPIRTDTDPKFYLFPQDTLYFGAFGGNSTLDKLHLSDIIPFVSPRDNLVGFG